MAHNVTGANIQDIYDRINDVDESHPLDANTFSDWSMEAGDMVTVKRGEEEYKSPVHSSKLVWRGTPQMTISSTGNKERDAVSKVSRKKYGRGGAAVRSQEYIYKELHSEDGYLHSVLAMTESYLRTDFSDDMNSLRGEFEVTAASMRADFTDEINSLHGELVVTAESMRADFTDEVNSLHGELVVTAASMRADFADEINSLHGELVVTAASMRADFVDEINSLHGELVVTAESMRADFTDEINSLHGELVVTAESMRADFTDEINSLHGELVVTAESMRADFTDEVNSLHGELVTTAQSLRSEYTDEIDSVRSSIEEQAGYIRLIVDTTDPNNPSIKAGEIAVEMNKTGSTARINANRIVIGDGSSHVTLNDALGINGTGAITMKGNTFVNGNLTMASGMEIIAGDIRATGVRFPGSNPGDDRTLTLSDVTGMIVDAEVSGNTLKLWKKGDPAATPSITFSKATSLSGTWSGSVLTVAASPQGNEYTIGFGSQTANQKLAVDIDRTTPPEPIVGTTNIRVPIHVYTPGTGQYDPAVDRWTGTASLSVGSLLEDKTSTNKITANGTYQPASGYMGFSSVEVNVPSQTITPVLTGGWNGTTFTVSSTPASTGDKGTTLSSKHSYDSSIDVHYIDVDATDTGAQAAVTRARYVLDLSTGSVSSGSRTIKVQYKGSDTGLEYVCNDYGNGQNAVTLNDAAWQYDGDNVSANNRNTNTVTVSTAGRPTQLSKSATVYLDTSASWSNNTKSIYVRRNNSSGEYVAIGSVTAPAPTVSGWSLGTYTSPYGYKPSVSVNGTTYTSGTDLNATGAYDAGWTAGQTGSSASSGARIELYRSPTGNIAYNTTYTIKAKGYSSRSATGKTDISGASITITTPADRYSDGQAAAGVSGAWGTGSGANVLTVSRELSSSTKSLTYTVTAGTPTFSYSSSTHKYSLTGTALVNNSQKASAVTSTGTEAYDGGVSDGKTAAGISASWGTGSGANVLTVSRALSSSTKSATYTVTAGVSASYNSSTHKYSLTGTASVNSSQKASSVSSTGTEAYDAGYTNGSPDGSGTVAENTGGTTWRIAVKRNDNTEVNTWINCNAIKAAYEAASGVAAGPDSGTIWRFAIKNGQGTEKNLWIDCAAIIAGQQTPQSLGIYDVNGNKVTSKTIQSAIDLWAEYWIGDVEVWGDKVTITPQQTAPWANQIGSGAERKKCTITADGKSSEFTLVKTTVAYSGANIPCVELRDANSRVIARYYL